MIVAALLSAIHMLTLALGLGAIFARGRALARPLDDSGWTRLLAADNAWGAAAALWIASGIARVFLGGKEAGFYWRKWLLLDQARVVRIRVRVGARADEDVHSRSLRAAQRDGLTAVPGGHLSPDQRHRARARRGNRA